MPKQPVRRRLATMYFIGIVGSTVLATELGDARWRELLTRFHKAEIRMPKGFWAGGIAADPAMHSLWVSNDRQHGQA